MSTTTMTIMEPMISEYVQECASTRKMLERVPENEFGWKPHEKSYTLCELASHLVNSQMWATMTVNTEKLEFDSSEFKPFIANNVKELLDTFDANVEEARKAMEGLSDADAMSNWSMWVDGKKMIEMPKVAVLRAFILSHMIHHRGQLSVYLRLKDVPLPQIYGPTADEAQM